MRQSEIDDEWLTRGRSLALAAALWCSDIHEQLPGFSTDGGVLRSTRSRRGGKALFFSLTVQISNADFLLAVPVAS